MRAVQTVVPGDHASVYRCDHACDVWLCDGYVQHHSLVLPTGGYTHTHTHTHTIHLGHLCFQDRYAWTQMRFSEPPDKAARKIKAVLPVPLSLRIESCLVRSHIIHTPPCGMKAWYIPATRGFYDLRTFPQCTAQEHKCKTQTHTSLTVPHTDASLDHTYRDKQSGTAEAHVRTLLHASVLCRVCPQTTTTYTVKVTTSPEGGFDGAVYLTLSNWWTEGREVLLANDRGAEAFAANAVETFTVAATDMSYVSKVRLEL